MGFMPESYLFCLEGLVGLAAGARRDLRQGHDAQCSLSNKRQIEAPRDFQAILTALRFGSPKRFCAVGKALVTKVANYRRDFSGNFDRTWRINFVYYAQGFFSMKRVNDANNSGV